MSFLEEGLDGYSYGMDSSEASVLARALDASMCGYSTVPCSALRVTLADRLGVPADGTDSPYVPKGKPQRARKISTSDTAMHAAMLSVYF